MATLPLGLPMPADGGLPEGTWQASHPADPALRSVSTQPGLAGGEGNDGCSARRFSAYVHVPFCARRCGYCDFNTYTAKELGPGASWEEYPQTVAAEIDFSARVLTAAGWPAPPALHSVFFGGGTPSLLGPRALGEILGRLRDVYGLEPGAEVTTEANPDSVAPGDMQALAAAGFTRVSLGMQSAVDHVLATLDRTHRQEHLVRALREAQQAGLQASVDLIYGTPGESLADWRTSLQAALDSRPDHISAYALVIEPGTKMGAQLARGQVAAVDPDDEAEKYELAEQMLGAAGYVNYEISNWALPNAQVAGDEAGSGEAGPNARRAVAGEGLRACRHNIAYWENQDWWGFGPGAHSHVGHQRWWNVKHPRAYAAALAAGKSPGAGREILDAQARLEEDIMLAIRLHTGLDLGLLAAIEAERQAVEPSVAGGEGTLPAGPKTWQVEVAALISEGLLAPAPALRRAQAYPHGRAVLTPAGRLLADTVTQRLLAAVER